MKFVTVRQRDANDCGCACLQAIIKFYNGYIPIEKIRNDILLDSGGATAYQIIMASKEYGLESKGLRVTYENLLLSSYPLIAHVILNNGYGHYIVIYKIKKDILYIMDPAKGKIKMPKDEFLNIWTNIVIIFHPTQKVIKMTKPKNVFLVFFSYISRFKSKYLGFVLLNIVVTFLMIIGSFYLSFMLDDTASIFSLKKLSMVFSFLMLMEIILTYLLQYVRIKLGYIIDSVIIKGFVTKIFSLPLNYLQKRNPSEFISRINDLFEIKNLFSDIVVSMFLDSILLIGSFIVLLKINWFMALLTLLFYFAILVINIIFSTKSYRNAHKILLEEVMFNNYLEDSILMISTIKNLSVEKNIVKKISNKLDELYYYVNIHSFNSSKASTCMEFIRKFGGIIIILVGAIMVAKSKFTITRLILYSSVLTLYEMAIMNINKIIPKYFFLKPSFDKISEFYNICCDDKKDLIPFKEGTIVFKNYSLSYDDTNFALKNININIKNKSHTLLTGKSGIGKSSLLKSFFTDNYKGEITIDDVNIKDYSLETIRQNIIYVGQNDRLFSGNIYENTTLYKKVSPKKFYNVCKICGVDLILKNKPFRYFTDINDQLNNLSGGERQRIILARSLLIDASVYLIDEALSEVDLAMEKEIIKNVKLFLKDKTVIYVSHKNVKELFKDIICLK